MKKILITLVTAVCIIGLASGNVFAASRSGGFQQENLYLGGGLGINSVSGFDDATGFQIFAGYELPYKLGDASTAIEVGYMDTGEFERTYTIGPLSYTVKDKATGLWVTGVAELPLDKKWGLLGRLGFDLGDDDGLMFGVGAGFKIDSQKELRAEYVIRDSVDSMQINFVYRFD